MVSEGNTEMRDPDAGHIRPAGRHLYVRDQAQFLKRIPELIAQLRMSRPENAGRLDLTPKSLDIVDNYVADQVDEILRQQKPVGEAIDPQFVMRVAAYAGEVIVRSKNGRWVKDDKAAAAGPLVVFRLQWTRADDSVGIRDKAIDIYEQVVRNILEGESLARWYQQETT